MSDAISKLPQKNALVKVEDGVAWVSLNRPEKRNAINPGIVFEMNQVLDALEETDAVKCVVITGSVVTAAAGRALGAGEDVLFLGLPGFAQVHVEIDQTGREQRRGAGHRMEFDLRNAPVFETQRAGGDLLAGKHEPHVGNLACH